MTTVRKVDLVVPLAKQATAMRIADTAGLDTQGRSGAVSLLTDRDSRRGDVDSTINRSVRQVPPGIRTSTMETRTGTTPTTSAVLWPSAAQPSRHHADFSFEDLVQAYLDCRRTKRNSASALAFETNLERNLCRLNDELRNGTYQPGKSICFVITRPKPREVWAAEFRDRIVHHLLYNRISPRFYAGFIADSCACIPGRGTLYGAQRLEAKIRSITQNWSKPAHYLKLDLANFFVSIDKHVVRGLLAKRIDGWWMELAELVLFHDPRQDFELRGDPYLLRRVPPHKRLTSQPGHIGLPIGNLSSQFFANVLLDALDQHIKHDLRCRHYVRYVDDMVLLHESPMWLCAARSDIETWLPLHLGLRLNPVKTILQPVDRGVDFVGQVIKPWHRTTRRRTYNEALSRVKQVPANELFETANSYFGLLRQASHSHHDRALLGSVLMYRGHSINKAFTKTFRHSTSHGGNYGNQ
ncbi:Retron-type reverse transcriptase [Sideroxydans lithotrophicus ES-1]|uniref:Retron-type reverse transcriptase n=2 Tax=Sideroxydans TaxID=314343 RepID=D5CUB0_SIDLE|nr:Retron-type reverse transcriptase [Sideroxydans lithotrophicus ES-1]